MIKIQIPSTYTQERLYIFSVMLGEFLGFEYQIHLDNRHDVCITMGDGKELLIADGLFRVPEEQWLKHTSMPRQPLKICNLNRAPITSTTVSKQVPVIYGDDTYAPDFFHSSENQIRLGLDIFGSAFFMLTRYEEMVKPTRDTHDRFPATASLAYQEGFLDRPIVNEYLEILWGSLNHLWPNLERKKREFKIIPTHDVDEPYEYAFKSLKWLFRTMKNDIFEKHNIGLAIRQAKAWMLVKMGHDKADPYLNFDWIMDQSEKTGLKSAFYFITDHCGRFDSDYSLEHLRIRKLLRRIYDRGHEIGYHGSYESSQSYQKTKFEFKRLKDTCEFLGIKRDVWGSRQHYLRWDVRNTWKNLDRVDLDYDTTLGFADCAGFRCGVCYEFPVFDLTTRQSLKLYEKPLIAMDRSLFSEKYMGLDLSNGLEKILVLKDRVRKYQGAFEILWHNNWFNGDEIRYTFYKNVIQQ